MPAVLALIAALVYGSSDFLGGIASRRTAPTSVVVWSQILGFVLLAFALAVLGYHATLGDVAWGTLCGVFGAAAIVALYRGLAGGAMGIVSALSAVVGAALPVLYGAAVHGERPAPLADAGIIAALVAVVLLCTTCHPEPPSTSSGQAEGRPQSRLRPGVVEGLIAGVMFGAYFIALAQTRPAAGLVPLLAARGTTIVLLVAGSALLGRTAALRAPRVTWLAILGCGAFDVSANVLFVTAFHLGGMISLVAVLTSLYPAATVALAALVLHERLRTAQWIGIVLALGGAAAIAGS